MVSCILKGLNSRHVHQVFFIFWYWLVIVKTLNILALDLCISMRKQIKDKELGHVYGCFRNSLGVMGQLCSSAK